MTQLMDRWPYEAYMKPVPNAREVLGTLRERGLKVGVLSNTLPSIDRTLRFVGLDDLVDVAVATCSVGVHKPDPGATNFGGHPPGRWVGSPANWRVPSRRA